MAKRAKRNVVWVVEWRWPPHVTEWNPIDFAVTTRGAKQRKAEHEKSGDVSQGARYRIRPYYSEPGRKP